VENHIVGAPCGVMDQMTAACGEANKLLAMVCQVSAISSGENNSAVFVLQIKKIMSNLMLVFVYVSAHKILNFHVLKNSLFASSI
jgi:hypothetical protein